MLQKETVSRTTLELLKNLMNDALLKDFFLAGGTALALQIGHRQSIDLDFFSLAPFDAAEVFSALNERYGFQEAYRRGNTLKGSIGAVQVDLITHNYPMIKPLIEEEGIRMASPEDIAAMKLSAISDNGTRLKDFIDIAYLSGRLTMAAMIEAFHTKYQSRNTTMVLKALCYHADINFEEPLQLIHSDYQWPMIAQRLDEMTQKPHHLFKAPLHRRKRRGLNP